MKNKFFSLLLALICFVSLLQPGISYAYESASSRITIIKQHQSKYKNLTVPGHSDTVYDSGCGLFSIAHAMQWLTNTKVTGDAEYNLIKQLVDWNLNTISSISESLKKLVKKDKTLIFHEGGIPIKTIKNNSLSKNEDFVKNIFDNGGVIIANPAGHYVVAVGYKYYSNKMYIQIVDSNAHSTIEPRGGLNLHIGYKYDSMEKIESGNTTGLQYWIPSQCFFGKCSHDRKFRDWWWLSGTSSYLKPAAPTSITLNQTVASLNLSDTLSLSAAVYPSNASKAVSWESSDTNIATVSSTGVVTAKKAGASVTITARSTADTNVTASCLVTTYYQQDTGTLKFTDIKYPHTYNRNKSISWSGKVESDVELASVVISVYNLTNKYTQSANLPSGAKSYNMSSFGDSLFKNLSTGKFTFELIATDVVGRKIGFANDGCQATTSGDNVYYNAPGSYSRPTLKGSAERNGHRYEVYEFEARLWDSDRDFAIEKGGHLATISDAEENAFICDLLTASGVNYAYLGAYYDNSGWHWVDGSPFNYHPWREGVAEDGTLNYTIAGIASPSRYTWVKSFNVGGMMCFIVEYDPDPVQSIVLEGSLTMIADEVQTLITTILPENAYNQALQFYSTNTSVATVNSNTGEVTAVGEGYTTIFAEAQDGSGVTGEFQLYVLHKPIEVTGLTIQADSSLYIDSKTIQLSEDSWAPLEATVYPFDADNQEVYFTSSNPDVAYFEMSSNVVVASCAGTCRLYGYTCEGEFSDYIDLVVYPSLENPEWSLDDNGVLTIFGTGSMEDYSWGTAPWYSSRDSIDTIIIQEGITGIGDAAFYDLYNLRNITIPTSVTRIGSGAFYGCRSLTGITIPSGVTSIGSLVFNLCYNLTEINVNTNNPAYASINGVLFNKEQTELICYPAGKTETSYIIPSGVTYVGSYAFLENGNLASVSLASSINDLGFGAFMGCTGLTDITIPSGLHYIENCAFEGCINLTNITIPSSVSYIGYDVFGGCSSLAGITVASDNAGYSDVNGILFDKDMMELICYPAGKPQTSYSIPYGVFRIAESAFDGCDNLTDIVIPASVHEIGNTAFESCNNLARVTILDRETYIGSNVFGDNNRPGLPAIAGWENSSADAYVSMYNVGSFVPLNDKTLFLPAELTRIESNAFSNTAAIFVVIPEEVTEIIGDPFAGSSIQYICGCMGTIAQSFASNNGYAFIPIDSEWIANY